mmetsp:Transcript_16790/g.29288  ORF Transcript_16790/g.29288 Transcript_16790/m.29288 type:complete len:323 (-) Transcript_16790:133-1101(-)
MAYKHQQAPQQGKPGHENAMRSMFPETEPLKPLPVPLPTAHGPAVHCPTALAHAAAPGWAHESTLWHCISWNFPPLVRKADFGQQPHGPVADHPVQLLLIAYQQRPKEAEGIDDNPLVILRLPGDDHHPVPRHQQIVGFASLTIPQPQCVHKRGIAIVQLLWLLPVLWLQPAEIVAERQPTLHCSRLLFTQGGGNWDVQAAFAQGQRHHLDVFVMLAGTCNLSTVVKGQRRKLRHGVCQCHKIVQVEKARLLLVLFGDNKYVAIHDIELVQQTNVTFTNVAHVHCFLIRQEWVEALWPRRTSSVEALLTLALHEPEDEWHPI